MDEKKLKVLALTVVLIMPVFFLLVFQPLGKVPRPKAPSKMFATGTKTSVNEKGEKVIDSVFQTIPNYKFQTQSGDSLALDSLRGNIYVADFFFATCPGICPILSNSLEKVQEAFVKDNNFKIVSFSVDPVHDSIPQLRAYAEKHDAVPGKWYFLRGSKSDVFALARDGFHITAKDDPDGGPEAFMHSEKLVLVDQDGNIRGYYSGVDSARVSHLMGDIVLLLRQTEEGYSFDKKPVKAK
ncbi:MAG TPA: SCO family protein [Chitinophagales bacterium]|nr:SCO family protein [Chitinophagales bacterium]